MRAGIFVRVCIILPQDDTRLYNCSIISHATNANDPVESSTILHNDIINMDFLKSDIHSPYCDIPTPLHYHLHLLPPQNPLSSYRV